MQAAGSGRGALTSLEPGRQKDSRIKEIMRREDQMLRRMDHSQETRRERQGQSHEGRPGGPQDGQSEGQPRRPEKDGRSAPRDHEPGKHFENRHEDLKKNDQGNPQEPSDGSGQPAGKKHQPKRAAPPPPKPPR